MELTMPFEMVEIGPCKLYRGDCLEVLPTLDADSIDSIVCDPPYHLTSLSRNGSPRVNDPETPFGRTKLGSAGFMGKTWDGGDVSFRVETWEAAMRVAKPGAMLLAFGGTRTFHRSACAIEDAGWEIRDTIMWVYGSGFPKSHDVSKAIDKEAGETRERIRVSNSTAGSIAYAQDEWTKANAGTRLVDEPLTAAAAAWSGWGTALKPAFEPVVVGYRPLTEEQFTRTPVSSRGCSVDEETESRMIDPVSQETFEREFNTTGLSGPEMRDRVEQRLRWEPIVSAE